MHFIALYPFIILDLSIFVVMRDSGKVFFFGRNCMSKHREPYSVKMSVVLKSIYRRCISEFGKALSIKDEVSRDNPNGRCSSS